MLPLRYLAAVAAVALCVASAPSAQPTDLTPQQASVYESYRLSVEVRTNSGYVARPVGASGAYNITRYDNMRWRTRRGNRLVPETTFYTAAGRPDIVDYIRRERASDFLRSGLGVAMVGAAVGLSAVANPDFTEGGTPNAAMIGVLFLGIGGSYYAYANFMDAVSQQTSPVDARAAAERYNAILLDEIRNAGPDAGAGGR